MQNFLTNLKTSQWNCTSALLTYERHKGSEYPDNTKWYKFMLDNSERISVPLIINSAIFELVNAVEYLSTSSITS